MKVTKLFCGIVILLAATAAFGANKYEGYSFTVEADNGGACPMRYLSYPANAITVYLAGTGQATAATGLTACDSSTISGGNTVNPNGDGRWCFTGSEDFYDVKLSTGVVYLWYPTTKTTGFTNVKDFRPVTLSGGVYTFSEPADYSKAIRNAVAYIAAKQGGTLYFPEGDYVVGTTNGNTVDATYKPITLPTGIVVQGASGNWSIPTTNLPLKTSTARIRLRNPNQTIFRIGGCTNNVTVRFIELLGNSPLYGEAARDATGDYGVEGLGKWIITHPSHQPQVEYPNSSLNFKFENVVFQNLDIGLYVHNANDDKCDPYDQYCGAWQFDFVKVDQCSFINNKTGITVDTYDTDWKITNTFLGYSAINAPGDGIRIKKAGTMLLEQTFGGGYDYGANIGGTFIYIDTIGTLTIINSESERGQRSIYTNPLGATRSEIITVVGSIFGDVIDLNGGLNYISTGNSYGATTVQADSTVMLTSNGDRFCYDPDIFPGVCKDGLGNTVSNPNFVGGRTVFQTGRPKEGSGADEIVKRPTFFGFDVLMADDDTSNNDPMLFSRSYNFNKPLLRLGQNYFYDFKRSGDNGFLTILGSQNKPYRGVVINGPVQFDKDMTFSDIVTYASTVFNGLPVITDGTLVYCKDCAKNGSGICVQGTAGVDGAFAKRINNAWRCD
jgi:hypothetical protein